MTHAFATSCTLPVLALLGVGLVDCSSSSVGAGGDGGSCYPDNNGLNGTPAVFDLTVDDASFSKKILSSENAAMITLTLKNTGTKPHGFSVGCIDVSTVYPDLPKGCSKTVCFPAAASIAALAPGASTTITFDTPTPDGLVWPFKSSEPADANVPGLNDGQWSVM